MQNLLFFVGLLASVQAVRTEESSIGAGDSGMAKVAELLNNILTDKLAAMSEMTTSYNQKVTMLDGQIAAARASLERATNQQRDQTAIKATSEARIKQAQGQLDAHQVELTKAELAAKTEKQMVDDSRADWEREAYDLQQGLEAVRQAITTLDAMQEAHPVNEPSLLQTPKTPSEKDMLKMMEAVASVVESVKVNLASKQDLEAITSHKQAFLQQKGMPDLPAGKSGPQTRTGPLELGLEHMQGISNVLAKLRDMSHEIQQLIADGAYEQQGKEQTYALFKRSNELAQANLKNSIEETNKELADLEITLQNAKRIIDETELQIAKQNELLNLYQQDQKFLAAQQTSDMQLLQAEQTVLREALKQISETSFLQTGQKLEIAHKPTSLIQLAERLRSKGKVDPEVAAKVANALSTFANKAHSTALSQLATKVESGISFSRLIKMINQMVASLQQALKDLDSRERWCKTEMKNTFATFESWELKEKTLQLEWNVAAADMAAKRQLLAELADENTKAQEARVDLAKMRNDEKGDYEKKKVENQNYIEALQKVIASLATQFSSGPSASAAQSTIALLKEIENDLQREATEIEVAENTAITVYKETDADLMQAIALRDEMIKQTDRAVVALHGQQQDIQADLGDTKDALIAAAESKEAVEDGCQKTNEMTTEEKQAQLQSEIAALKDAMSILES